MVQLWARFRCREDLCSSFVFPLIAGIALSVPAIAQDPYHIRVGDRVYDIGTGSYNDGVVLSGL